jgi:hypothetical protein
MPDLPPWPPPSVDQAGDKVECATEQGRGGPDLASLPGSTPPYHRNPPRPVTFAAMDVCEHEKRGGGGRSKVGLARSVQGMMGGRGSVPAQSGGGAARRRSGGEGAVGKWWQQGMGWEMESMGPGLFGGEEKF